MTPPSGPSQIGMFDFVPVLGYREYWYPALLAREVGTRPRKVKMLGDEIVFFRDAQNRVAALWDRCPHRGALLSNGRCEFPGTISCAYHGYTFDGTGACVAAITEGPDSGQVGKVRARAYPTAELRGVVFVWMGQTAPVAIEDDVPPEFVSPQWAAHPYVKTWPANWAVTMENVVDGHFSWVHRYRFRRFLNLDNFRKIPAYIEGTQIVEGDGYIGIKPAGRGPEQAYYPGIGQTWPRHVWWRVLRPRIGGAPTHTGKPYVFEYRLPGIISVDYSNRVHMRWAVPIDRESTRTFTFGLYRAATPWQRLRSKVHFHTVHQFFVNKGTNELEDLPIIRTGRLDPFAPEKLGANDRAIIYWRRRMAQQSRDAVRLGDRWIPSAAPEDREATELPGRPR